jgi:hypothetical protein
LQNPKEVKNRWSNVIDKSCRIFEERLWLKKGCFGDDDCTRFFIPVNLKSLAAMISGLKYMLAFTSKPMPAKMAALSVVRCLSKCKQFKETIRLEETLLTCCVDCPICIFIE